METFEVAHIREQGVDLIIVPLAEAFDFKSVEEKRRITLALQVGARAAGLRGTVVPVWDSCGRMAFLAPQGFHPFFRSIDLGFVLSNVNRQLTLSMN